MAKRKSRKSDRWLLKHIFAPKPERQKSDPERARREEELFLRMDRIIASEGLYLNKNLSLAMIAREVGTNRTYLSAVLRNRDFTFSSYLGSFRVQRVLQLLKNTEAQATMNAGWEQTAGKKGGFQALIANKEQAKKLDQANKAVITGDDADALIKEKLDQIAREPKNMNFRRALARIYVQNKRFEEAIQCLTDAIEAAGSMDPELDRMLSQTYVSYYDQQIEAYRAAGDEENAIEMENQKNQFVFDDLAQRVERYPNDLHLRYELGLQYYTYEYYDEALEHLQLAQKSPKDRLWALYYLAMCFLKKGQTDMAVMQLETARDAIPTMDDLKKKIVYQLGRCAEDSGDLERAYQYYKDVYAADVGFEDLGERMLAVSQKLKSGK